MSVRKPRLDPKNSTYQKNGTGRDSYIAFNNGGVYRDVCLVTGGFERGQFPWKRHYGGNQMPVRAKMIHYQNNGSGRDSYIECNSGGLSSMDLGRTTFIGSLRNYSRSKRTNSVTSQMGILASFELSPNRLTYMNDSLKGKTILKAYRGRINSQRQMESVERLSSAKVREDPYRDFRTHTSTFYK